MPFTISAMQTIKECNSNNFNCNSKKECQCKIKGLINQNILETIDEENNLTDYEISLQKLVLGLDFILNVSIRTLK